VKAVNSRLTPIQASFLRVKLKHLDAWNARRSKRDFRYNLTCSVVLIHDTVPLDELTQRPDRQRKFYTGDVWKTVLCLKHYRQDLDIFTIATPWRGLTVVTALNPASRILGDRYQEGVLFFILGKMAAQQDRLAEGVRLVALCVLIDRSIVHPDTASDQQAFEQMMAPLGYTQQQVDALLEDVGHAYAADRGWGLLTAAFSDR